MHHCKKLSFGERSVRPAGRRRRTVSRGLLNQAGRSGRSPRRLEMQREQRGTKGTRQSLIYWRTNKRGHAVPEREWWGSITELVFFLLAKKTGVFFCLV